MHPKYWKSGRKAVYQSPADEGSTAGGELDANSAGAALDSLFGDDEGQAENVAQSNETPEAAAERLAAEEAGANHDADADGAQESDQYDENATVTVKIDGKLVELTLAQVAEAEKSKWQQADYTRKTQEAAETRKVAEAETQKARSERDQYAQGLQQILSVNNHLAQQDKAWTPEAIDADPIGYMQYRHAADARAQQSQQAQAELQHLGEQQKAEFTEAAKAHQAQQLEAIQAKLPAWKDAAVRDKEVGEIKQWLFGQGFTEADLGNMQDHRMVLMARSAMQHEQLLTRAKATAQKVAKVQPKVAAPGRQPVAATDGRTTAMKRLNATGSIADAAAAFGAL